MSIRRGSNRRVMENFLVATGDQAVYNTAGATNHINNTTTGAVRLASGQLGFFSGSDLGSVALNIATDTTPTVTEAPVLYIAQGTADSAAPGASTAAYPLFSRPFERSGDIHGNNGLLVTKQAYQAPTHSIWTIGDVGAVATGAINVLDNTEYAFSISFYSTWLDARMHGSMNTNVFVPSYVTPNYTALGTTNPLDHLIKNLVYNINVNSAAVHPVPEPKKKAEPVVAFALDLSGTVGTAIAGLSAGNLAVYTDTTGAKSITLTAEQVTNIQAAFPAGSSIINVDLSTAGTLANQADAIAIMGWDRDLVYDDKLPQVKTRVVLGLRRGFTSTVHSDETSFAFEGNGQGKTLDLLYRASQGQRKYFLSHRHDPIIEFPSPVVTTTNYVTYVLEHYNQRHIDSFNTLQDAQKEYILIPTTGTTTIGQFDTALNAYVASAGGAVLTV